MFLLKAFGFEIPLLLAILVFALSSLLGIISMLPGGLGVTEGSIGSERIIKMLRVVDDELVVDRKGIYSIEKFLIARRLMYWQVYLHKTVTAAEQMLIKTLERARQLGEAGEQILAPPVLSEFLLQGRMNPRKMNSSREFLDAFARLDDNDY